MRIDPSSETQAACNPNNDFRKYGTFGTLKYVYFRLTGNIIRQ